VQQYCVGFGMSLDAVAKFDMIPQSAWTPAYDADQKKPRDSLGNGLSAFATITRDRAALDTELRHRRRARWRTASRTRRTPG
jgi:hypothetical protein